MVKLTISEALKKIKQKKNELSLLLRMRQDNYIVIIPKMQSLEEFLKDKKAVNFSVISKEITELILSINELREKVLRTNINTKIQIKSEGKTNEVSLSALQLLIELYRSELSSFSKLNSDPLFFNRIRGRIKTTEEEDKEIKQISDIELKDLIKSSEEKKIELESILERANANTYLLD